MKKTTESALPGSYEPFREWMKMQQEFMSKMTADTSANNWIKDAPRQMAQWMEGKNPMFSLPFTNQYMEVYNHLFRHWEPFSQMIKEGIYEQEVLDKYFSHDAYRKMIGKLLNFGPTDRWSKMLEKSNEVMEHWIEYSNEVAPTMENTMAMWDRSLQKYAPKGINPIFDVLNEINRYIREILDPFYSLVGPHKEVRLMQLMREIQFNYISFHVKVAELQGIILEASNLALPDALEAANEMYRKQKEMPEFKTFFLLFLDKLEFRITQALRSEKYAKLQNKVAKTGVTVKSKLDEMVEWSLHGLPIVTKSEEDNIALELHTLREKIRHLTEELAQVKKQNGAPVEG